MRVYECIHGKDISPCPVCYGPAAPLNFKWKANIIRPSQAYKDIMNNTTSFEAPHTNELLIDALKKELEKLRQEKQDDHNTIEALKKSIDPERERARTALLTTINSDGHFPSYGNSIEELASDEIIALRNELEKQKQHYEDIINKQTTLANDIQVRTQFNIIKQGFITQSILPEISLKDKYPAINNSENYSLQDIASVIYDRLNEIYMGNPLALPAVSEMASEVEQSIAAAHSKNKAGVGLPLLALGTVFAGFLTHYLGANVVPAVRVAEAFVEASNEEPIETEKEATECQ